MKIAIGSDHAAFLQKAELIECMHRWGYETIDCGAFDDKAIDYPDIVEPVCDAVLDGRAAFGVLLCGTGIGMSIAANKIDGIRCAHCPESYSARLTRLHNDANVLAMGARTLGVEVMIDILKTFLATEYTAEERNVRRIAKAMALYGKARGAKE